MRHLFCRSRYRVLSQIATTSSVAGHKLQYHKRINDRAPDHSGRPVVLLGFAIAICATELDVGRATELDVAFNFARNNKVSFYSIFFRVSAAREEGRHPVLSHQKNCDTQFRRTRWTESSCRAVSRYYNQHAPARRAPAACAAGAVLRKVAQNSMNTLGHLFEPG